MNAKYWKVRTSLPSCSADQEERLRAYMGYRTLGVLAESFEDAVSAVMDRIPGVIIVAVEFSGRVDFDVTTSRSNT